MAKIIENKKGRRQIKLNFSDVLAIIEEYQIQHKKYKNTASLKLFFDYFGIYLPEDV